MVGASEACVPGCQKRWFLAHGRDVLLNRGSSQVKLTGPTAGVVAVGYRMRGPLCSGPLLCANGCPSLYVSSK